MYLIAGLVLLSVLVGGFQQIRVVAAHHETAKAQSQTAAAQGALAAYQVAASNEIIKRIAENGAIEAQARKNVEEVRGATQSSIDAVRARYERLRKQTAAAAGYRSTMPAAAGSEPRAVDAGPVADTGELPRCVASDRRADLEQLLASADYCAAALKGCRDAVGTH